MDATTLVLDKEFSSALDEDLGKIGIRVVVFSKTKKTSQAANEEVLDLDAGEDFSVGDSEVSGYLESPSRGKLCCVFSINGQRHHGLDNSFIVHELRMKYLRKRMIIVVDLDGLTARAIAEVIQGSRSGFYEGKVYHRIQERLISTLKSDPDLLELEEEAEEELSQLQVGDAAVQEALDQLIHDHFEGGDHTAEGPGGAAGKQGLTVKDKGKKIQLEVVKPASEGAPASYPVLLCSHPGNTYRLRPGVKGRLLVSVEPVSEWPDMTDLVAVTEPSIDGFSAQLTPKANHAAVDLEFVEPAGFDQDQYPLELRVSLLATFKGQPELRLTDKLVVVRPPKRPPPPPVLFDEPTFVRVASRQPVRLLPGSAATHVRMRWDGKDELVSDSGSGWHFEGVSGSPVRGISFSFTRPSGGRFEALIHTSEELLIGAKFKFEIRAIGPGRKQLVAPLEAEVVKPQESLDPRKVKAELPGHGQRRPPYELKIIKEETFSSNTRWGEETWDATHAGAFIDPKQDAPLTLCINQDLSLLKSYMDSLVAKKADEKRTEEKKTKYISHVAYHLYQMYLHKDQRAKEKLVNADVAEPRDEDMQQEINRVAGTLIKLMEVSR